jgi:hypothetical protein
VPGSLPKQEGVAAMGAGQVSWSRTAMLIFVCWIISYWIYGLVTDFLVRDANKKAPPQRSLSDPRLSRQVQLRLHFGERRCTDGFLLRCAQDNDCDTGPAPISRVHSAPEKQLDVSDAGRALFTDAVSSM